MKRLFSMILAPSVLTLVAAAQDDPAAMKMKFEAERLTAQAKIIGVRGAIMGDPVKNAPYSGTEISESTQVLADGTRIHNETQTLVYRDSAGRTRRETPNEITIWDPVANTSYLLNPKTQTARKLPVGSGQFFFATGAGGKNLTYTYSVTTTSPDGNVQAKVVQDAAEAEAKGKMTVAMDSAPRMGPELKIMKQEFRKGTTEALGKQTIEGVSADGSRITETIDAGAIGNDRPLQIVSERWFSSDLQTVIRMQHNDPRTGEETFRLTNISRTEPAGYLFEVPAGYQIIDPK
jgi:hypothetical protein